MKHWWSTLALGFALFSMFFGAGNLVFPLTVGKVAGSQSVFAITGLCVTAVFLPLLGLVGLILYDGDYKSFFRRLGRIPGFALLLLIHLVLGPFGSIPRLFTLSHATLAPYFNIPMPIFCVVAAVIVFMFTIRQRRIVDIIGYVLTPVLLLSLAAIITLGIVGHPDALAVDQTAAKSLTGGLRSGYDMLDLLAAFLFGRLILARMWLDNKDQKSVMRQFLKASLIASVLLGAIYAGLGMIASYHAHTIDPVAAEGLLSAISRHLLGPTGGAIASLAIMMACLTTAISLVAIFAEFLRKDLLKSKVSRATALIITLVVSSATANLGFGGIMRMLGPIIVTCHPILIALCVVNIAIKLRQRKENIAPIQKM